MQPVSGPYTNVNSFKEDDSRFSDGYPYLIWRKSYLHQKEEICLHYHDVLEILLSNHENGKIFIEGSHYQLQKQTVYIIPPGILHSANIESGEGDILMVQVSLLHLSHYINILNIDKNINNNHFSFHFSHKGYSDLIPFLTNLEEKTDIYEKLILFLQIFRVISRMNNSENIKSTKRVNKNLQKIKEITNWTKQHFFDPDLKIEWVAEMHGYNKSYFCRFFKHTTGITYNEYLTSYRLEQAKYYLAQGESVSSTCYRCGFNALSYFVQLFKSKFGITPLKYQKKLK